MLHAQRARQRTDRATCSGGHTSDIKGKYEAVAAARGHQAGAQPVLDAHVIAERAHRVIEGLLHQAAELLGLRHHLRHTCTRA